MPPDYYSLSCSIPQVVKMRREKLKELLFTVQPVLIKTLFLRVIVLMQLPVFRVLLQIRVSVGA
jgi:hypothetical protein